MNRDMIVRDIDDMVYCEDRCMKYVIGDSDVRGYDACIDTCYRKMIHSMIHMNNHIRYILDSDIKNDRRIHINMMNDKSNK